jgi:serine/threonine protein kinase
LSNAFAADEPPSSVKVTTPTQTSPEHFSKGQVTQASDVYAFGMLWWELFNGQRVWPSMGPEAIKKKVLNKEIPSMPDEFGKGVENLMLDCLSFKPSNRPSFAEVVKRIAIMQQELRTGRPMTGVAAKGGDDGGLMKGRLFRDRPKENKATNGNSAPSPHILEKASQDTADQQKKSVFKRFADKFKV